MISEVAEPGCEIDMEACKGAHHWARQLRARGFRVKTMAPQYVKPYVPRNNNDAKDAQGICEAMSRPRMTFVPVKTVEQQGMQAVHRIHTRLVGRRTARGNQIRGLVAEYGLVAPKELSSLHQAIPRWVEDADNGLRARFLHLLGGLWHDLVLLDERVAELERDISVIAKTNPDAERLQQLRAVGPMIATALVVAMGHANQYTNGRQLAVSPGLTPAQHSSDGKEKLLGISKPGNTDVRSLLVHGARAMLRTAATKDDAFEAREVFG